MSRLESFGKAVVASAALAGCGEPNLQHKIGECARPPMEFVSGPEQQGGVYSIQAQVREDALSDKRFDGMTPCWNMPIDAGLVLRGVSNVSGDPYKQYNVTTGVGPQFHFPVAGDPQLMSGSANRPVNHPTGLSIAGIDDAGNDFETESVKVFQ